jgi:hypothetical protein
VPRRHRPDTPVVQCSTTSALTPQPTKPSADRRSCTAGFVAYCGSALLSSNPATHCFYGTRSRDRTGKAAKPRNFKSLVSTYSTIRAGWAIIPARKRKQGKCAMHFPCFIWSGKRVSNSRPIPWQGIALPTELFPHFFTCRLAASRPENPERPAKTSGTNYPGAGVRCQVQALGSCGRAHLDLRNPTPDWRARNRPLRHGGELSPSHRAPLRGKPGRRFFRLRRRAERSRWRLAGSARVPCSR